MTRSQHLFRWYKKLAIHSRQLVKKIPSLINITEIIATLSFVTSSHVSQIVFDALILTPLNLSRLFPAFRIDFSVFWWPKTKDQSKSCHFEWVFEMMLFWSLTCFFSPPSSPSHKLYQFPATWDHNLSINLLVSQLHIHTVPSLRTCSKPRCGLIWSTFSHLRRIVGWKMRDLITTMRQENRIRTKESVWIQLDLEPRLESSSFLQPRLRRVSRNCWVFDSKYIRFVHSLNIWQKNIFAFEIHSLCSILKYLTKKCTIVSNVFLQFGQCAWSNWLHKECWYQRCTLWLETGSEWVKLSFRYYLILMIEF